jgi:hypothetical protein
MSMQQSASSIVPNMALREHRVLGHLLDGCCSGGGLGVPPVKILLAAYAYAYACDDGGVDLWW